MTKRNLATALLPLLFVLVAGMAPASGNASVAPTLAPAAQVPPVTPPATTAPDAGKSVAKPFGGDLFAPAAVPMCEAGACFGNGTPCGSDGVCFMPKGTGCGVCLE